VRSQIAERQSNHQQSNESRKLSKEERLEKEKANAQANADMGLFLSVYHIALKKDEMHNKIKFLINKNCMQLHDITGVILVAPSFTTCILESGSHSSKAINKLLTRRIKYRSIIENNGETTQLEGEEKEDHTCRMLHQGQIRKRSMKRYGNIRETSTDGEAADVMKRLKLETFWTMAKSIQESASTS
jgi:U4/U6 small nuclear ribonucleoprotein PRP3